MVDRILEKTPKNERKLINTFLNYPDNSAGSLMTPDYISLRKEWNVAQALEHIKEVGMDAETIPAMSETTGESCLALYL